MRYTNWTSARIVDMAGLKLSTLALGIAVALSGMASPASAQPASGLGKHSPVSSDGSELVPTEDASSRVNGERGFRGAPGGSTEGQIEDSLAEFAADVESTEEVWKLWSLKPAKGAGRESIIGADSRVLVNPTTSYPARAVVLITFDGGRCTGWLYGPDIVGTAGHCVHSGGSGGSWFTNVRVYPGRNGSSSPYGSCSARRLHSVVGWTDSSDENYDYGAIKLNCSIGNTTGWFGYWRQSATLTGLPTIISGYPGDKPLTQWKSTDQVRVTQARKIFYLNDTVGGMSGSPVYYNRPAGSPFCSGNCSMAIHTNGLHGSSSHSEYNHGTRIVQPVFDNLFNWKNTP